MATTAKGTPYVVSTDLVANYPTVSSDLATHIDAKLAYNAVSINAQTGSGANAYTFALADASEGKLVTASNAAAATYTVPPQSSVTWADGAVLRILNQGAGTVTIAAGAGVTINGTPLTLAQYKGAALQRTASNTWTILPFAGGVGNANFSDAATGTYTSGGINYKYKTYNASSTLTITDTGFIDVLIVAGGGAGGRTDGNNSWGSGGGGGGGVFDATDLYITAGTYTVTVGAGGADQTAFGGPGGDSSLSTEMVGVGGGGGGANWSGFPSPGGKGGSGGGSSTARAAGSGTFGQGNDGAAANGGGGGGAGGAASGTTAGAGQSSSITGAAVTYAAGGAGTGATAGGANTGNGGGGRASSATGAGTAGGSGVIVVRVKV